jgi:hypothetical protein
VLRSCAGEMEREVHSILGPLGVKEALSRLVADDLRSVEDDLFDRPHGTTQGSEGVVEAGAVAGSSSTKKSWWPSWSNKTGAIALGDDEEGGQPKGNEEMGLTAFLLKFGEGMGECEAAQIGNIAPKRIHAYPCVSLLRVSFLIPLLSLSEARPGTRDVLVDSDGSEPRGTPLTRHRGSAPIPPVHLRTHHRSLVLHRRPHPSRAVHGRRDGRDGPHHLLGSDGGGALHLWRVQDVLYVSGMSRANREPGNLIPKLSNSPIRKPACGAVRTELTWRSGAEGGWGGYLYGATSTMVVGGLAAGAAYGLVKALGVQE